MEQQSIITVPGRLCLMGEHSDWAADFRVQNPAIPPGAALVVGLTQEHITAEVTQLPDKRLHLSSPLAGNLDLPYSSASLQPVIRDASNIWRFAAAAAHIMRARFHAVSDSVHGMHIKIIEETLPAARGFSSSAAICTLVARAFNVAFKLGLTVAAEMDIAYAAERMTGSACGRMDQIVAIGQGRVASMTFDIESVDFEPVHIPDGSHVYIVVADLGSSKDTALILRSLQTAYPNDQSHNAIRLRTYLGERNRIYVQQMTDALINADAEKLGSLMTQAQAEFDAATIPFCPQQLTAPHLHATLTDVEIQPLVYGGKGGTSLSPFFCCIPA